MQQTLKLVSVLTISSVLLLTGCGKDKGGSNTKSRATLLTQSGWTRTSQIITLNANPPYDDHLTLAPCLQDDRYVFYTNGSFEINEGPTKCNAGDPQVKQTGTWSLAVNDTQLIFGGSTFTIDQLTESTLVVTYTISSGGSTFTSKTTYVH